MNDLEDKQSSANADFELSSRNFCEAAADLSRAVYDLSIEDAKHLHESLKPVYVKVAVIRDEINAAKRKERTDEFTKRMPCEGEDVLVDVCPCGDETWMQIGKVLHAWHDDDRLDDVWAAVEITRRLTEEENHGWQTDDSWNQCVFVCHLSYRGDDWRALLPANDRAREEWRCE